MKFSECPNCNHLVDVGEKPRSGQKVTCRSFKTDLEIYWLDPISLDWVSDLGKYTKQTNKYNFEKDILDNEQLVNF